MEGLAYFHKISLSGRKPGNVLVWFRLLDLLQEKKIRPHYKDLSDNYVLFNHKLTTKELWSI